MNKMKRFREVALLDKDGREVRVYPLKKHKDFSSMTLDEAHEQFLKDEKIFLEIVKKTKFDWDCIVLNSVRTTPNGNEYLRLAMLYNYEHQPVIDFIDDLIEDRKDKIKRIQKHTRRK